MPDPLFSIDIDVKPDFDDLSNDMRDKMTIATVESHRRTLADITGFMSYTATSNPSQPSNSTYRRTFDLLRSFKEQITHKTPPVIISIWSATVSYAQYVIGDKQAAIHRNRWFNRDMIIQKAEFLHRESLSREIDREIRI